METLTKHPSVSEVKVFLEKHHGSPVATFTHIQEGKHSDAFSYVNEGKEYVARFNVTDQGFLKDRYAFEHFSGPQILIPKILEIGKYNDALFYCISEKVGGETVKEQYARGDFGSLPIQFKTVEEIKTISVDSHDLDMYFKDICTGGVSDWTVFKNIPYFDKNFVEHLLAQIQKYGTYSTGERVLVHGDFGGSNLIMNGEKVAGIIDWALSFYGDYFWDVGRIVLFCPNRKATTEAALNFYKDLPHYKERIAWGVYCVMLKNYGIALQSGQETSCLSSVGRIKEIEDVLSL